MNKRSYVISGLIILGIIYSMAIGPGGGPGGAIQSGMGRIAVLADDSPICSDAPFEIANELTSITEGDILWNQTYGGAGFDHANTLIQTADGGFALAGVTGSFGAGESDAWLVRTDAHGQMEWQQTYGGAGVEGAEALIQTADGGFALAGITASFGAGKWDAWLVKTDAHGTMEWQQTYGGASGELANAAIQTADGGFALAGWTESFGAGKGDAWLVKTDAHGQMEWQQTYGGSDDSELFRAMVQTADGGFALAYLGNKDAWLVKTYPNGTTQWNQTYGGAGEVSARAVIQTKDGGFALAGETESFGADNHYALLVKTDAHGTMEWQQTYGGWGNAGIQTADGGFALAGYIDSFGAGKGDAWLVKTYPNGTAQWNQTYGGAEYDEAYAVIQTKDGGCALAGYTTSFGAGEYDAWLVKTVSITMDTDGDGLYDLEEAITYGTDFQDPDTDNDGLSDGAEVTIHNTNPTIADTDGDTYSDGEEVDAGFDPNDPAEYPTLPLSTPPPLPPTTGTIEPPIFFIPGFTLVELVLAITCLVILARRKTKSRVDRT